MKTSTIPASTPAIEPLESRIAPATLVNPTTVTYQDTDGDAVTIKLSKPLFDAATIDAVLTFSTGLVDGSDTTPQQLQAIDFTQLITPTDANGVDVTVSVKRSLVLPGDGLARVGAIEASGLDLGVVKIAGDLGRIIAGDTLSAPPSLKSLHVATFGIFGTETQPAGGSTVSGVAGDVGSFVVSGDVAGVFAVVGGGKLGALTIGGSLRGTSDANSGAIQVNQGIGTVKIGHDILVGLTGSGGVLLLDHGGIKSLSIGGSIVGGQVRVEQAIGTLSLGGSLVGAAQDDSGVVIAGFLPKVTIQGNVVGGAGQSSGALRADEMGTVSIGGSLHGGSGTSSGRIVGNVLGKVAVKGGVFGGTGQESGTIDADHRLRQVEIGALHGGVGEYSGRIKSNDVLGSVKIRESLTGGNGSHSGGIFAQSSLDTLTVGGSIVGSAGVSSGEVIAGSRIGTIRIAHDLLGGSGLTSGYLEAQQLEIGQLHIGGSIIGGAGGNSAFIYSSDGIDLVRIGGDLAGGSGGGSGQIDNTDGELRDVTIGGSLVGSSGSHSGSIYSDGNIGKIKIAGSIIGGTASNAGSIRDAQTKFASLYVGGSIIGGTASGTGFVDASTIGSLTVRGDLIGGTANVANQIVTHAGAIEADHLPKVVIGGDIIAGSTAVNAGLGLSPAISSQHEIGSLTVGGSLVGNRAYSIVISARGAETPTGDTDLAIGSIKIGGSVSGASIAAGYDPQLTIRNSDAQIGSVSVGGDWHGSNLVAGVFNGGDALFGTADDVKGNFTTDSMDRISRIASIVIGGQLSGASGLHSGFAAQHVGSLKIAGALVPLTSGAGNDTRLLDGTTHATLHELSIP